ncbi:MAG: hypothetical protein II825_11355 [Paludibacteraceae bacterium]|nr:hypothetical protein [Paludibacteraceae bacterium]MBQ6777371.1 hypothetical protein [Paludibacteraceae bacterium]
MTITIQSSGIHLDLPIDTKLSIEMSSPIFSIGDSSSLPLSLPLTAHNRRALNFPDRIDFYDSGEESIRAFPDIPVIVTHGSWQQTAIISISSCSELSAEVTMYFMESDIWSRLDGITLPQAMAGKHFGEIPPVGANVNTYRSQVVNSLYQYMIPNTSNDLLDWLKTHDFIVAPVYTEDGWLNELACVRRYIGTNDILHEQLNVAFPYGMLRDTPGVFRLRNEQDWYTSSELFGKRVPIVDDTSDSSISIVGNVVGYRNNNQYLYITAFLRLDVVIKSIFEYVGLSVEYDFNNIGIYDRLNGPHYMEKMWHKMLLLNNTMDAIYPGAIFYSSIVPECSCKEFITAVMAQFGVFFSIQPDHRTVKMHFLEKELYRYTTDQYKSFRNTQISFNSEPEYNPADNISDLDKVEEDWTDMDSVKDGYQVEHNMPGSSGIEAIILDGTCRRTSSNPSLDENKKDNKKCPLAFAIYEESRFFTTGHYTNPSTGFTAKVFTPIISSHFNMYTIEPNPDDYDTDVDDMKLNTERGLHELLTRGYCAIAKQSDKITITQTMPLAELSNFDWIRPIVIRGRLCWPCKLRYELQHNTSVHVTMEMIAPRLT